MGHSMFVTLYNSNIIPEANYAAAVWGFKDYSAPRVRQNKISRFHLGVHQFTPVPATSREMNIPNIQLLRWPVMVRYHNRMAKLKEQGLPRVAYQYEMTCGVKGWIEELKVITRLLHLTPPSLDIMYDMDNVQAAVQSLAQERW